MYVKVYPCGQYDWLKFSETYCIKHSFFEGYQYPVEDALIEIDLNEAINHGIASGGAALVVSLALMLPRWVFIGMRSDFRRWRERRAEKRKTRQIARSASRKEPALRREQNDPASNTGEAEFHQKK